MASIGKYAPWRLWILVVFWICQFILLGIELAISILAIILVARNSGDIIYSAGSKAEIAIQFTLAVLSLALTIAEPIKLTRNTLTPLFYLISNAVKSAIWIALLIAALVINTRRNDIDETYIDSDGYTHTYNYRPAASGIASVFTIIICLLFVLPVIYGAIIFHKNRRNRGAYNGVARSDPEGVNMGGMGVGAVGDGYDINSVNSYYAPAGAPSHAAAGKPVFASQIYGQPQQYGQPLQYGQPQQYGQTQPHNQPQVYEAYGGAATYR